MRHPDPATGAMANAGTQKRKCRSLHVGIISRPFNIFINYSTPD
jgi:hypothetical protein